MFKQIINKLASFETLFMVGYEYGKNSKSNPEQPTKVITENTVENVEIEHHFELRVVLFVIVIRLITILMKLLIKNQRPVE